MKILVVDDEQPLAALLERTLRRLGHQPVVALDPGDALALFGPDVDAVITDIEMPEMNGIEMALAMRDLDDALPVAFCTGSDPNADVVARAAAVGPVLSKTWTQDEIRQLLAELGRRRGRAGPRC